MTEGVQIAIIGGSVSVVVAAITIAGSILNARMTKKLERVEKKRHENNLSEVENNILEELVPVFEKKDIALDRLADIMEGVLIRLDHLERLRKQQGVFLESRCLAPELIEEVKKLQEEVKHQRRDKELLDSLIESTEGGEQLTS